MDLNLDHVSCASKRRLSVFIFLNTFLLMLLYMSGNDNEAGIIVLRLDMLCLVRGKVARRKESSVFSPILLLVWFLKKIRGLIFGEWKIDSYEKLLVVIFLHSKCFMDKYTLLYCTIYMIHRNTWTEFGLVALQCYT